MERQSGILMPVFSLPSVYGVGTFGKESYNFVDFLRSSRQKVWQILPLVQTGLGNSPYSSVSSISFNPYFISPDVLFSKGLLTADDLFEAKSGGAIINYQDVEKKRMPLLKKAYGRFDKKDSAFQKFVRSGEYRDYALFLTLKGKFGLKPFYEWPNKYKRRDIAALSEFEKENREEILFWQFLQFEAKSQWFNLKDYANRKGVKIMGDIPLYVALDSVDVWTDPSIFKLDKNFKPKKVAGVPPDYFSRRGQLWGNPVYDYKTHKASDFCWWIARLKRALYTFDYIRIDHFRGLDRYYEVDAAATDATEGKWVKAPGKELFDLLKAELKKEGRAEDDFCIIAEDLGIIDDGVRKLLKYSGFPGMKVLSFAFNGEKDNLYLPENIEENAVCYTGTHDNDTFMGMLNSASSWDYENVRRGIEESASKLGVEGIDTSNRNGILDAALELGFKCKARLFITTLQDLKHYGTEFRINEPGTVKPENWSVKFEKKDFDEYTVNKLKRLTEKYGR